MSTATRVYAHLRDLARSTGRATDEILTLYGLEQFIDRLTRTPYADDFVLKGGVLMAAYLLRRPTRDVDMQALDFTLDEKHMRQVVNAVAAVDIDDALVLDTKKVTVEHIRDEDEYSGLRVGVPARVHTHRFEMKLDVSTGDPISPAPRTVELPRLLGGHITVVGHPPEMVVAEKTITLLQRGTASTRWRDYLDVRNLARRHPFKSYDLFHAAQAVADHRQVELGPLATVIDGYGDLMQTRWRAWRRKFRLEDECLESLDEQVAEVAAFVDPVYARNLAGPARWNPAKYRWS